MIKISKNGATRILNSIFLAMCTVCDPKILRTFDYVQFNLPFKVEI